MFAKFKIAAVLTAASLALVGCSSEAEKTSKRLQDYTPDTSLPMSQQIADSGVATDPYEFDEEEWKEISMGFCYDVLKIDDNPEHETTDDIMIHLGFDDIWDREERDTVARIMSANHCPNRITE